MTEKTALWEDPYYEGYDIHRRQQRCPRCIAMGYACVKWISVDVSCCLGCAREIDTKMNLKG